VLSYFFTFKARRGATRDEGGLAMIIVIIVIMLMTLISLTMFSQAISQLPLARHDQDHEAALASAEAGADDYLNHLAQNGNYWTYNPGNPPPDGNQAFNAWVPVAGPSNNGECFRYDVNTTSTAATGIVYLTSSGKRLANPNLACSTAGVTRTVSLGLRRQGFLDYLWLTDYEIIDPVLSGASTASCKYRAWQYNPTTGSYGPDQNANPDCSIVYWTTLASLNGPVHSNDGLYVCGNPSFLGSTDTYYNSATSNNQPNTFKFGGGGTVLNPLNCANAPVFGVTNPPQPVAGSFLAFPPVNTSIRNQADGVMGGKGCLYTGPTTITLNATGTMDVTSPGTLSTNAGCGPGLGKNLPQNGVIYVQNVPAGADPNHSNCSGNACIGDVNVSGTLNGQLTIASMDDIDITGNLTYQQYPGGDDVLGLVANNDVAVVHAANATVQDDLTIDAAIMSLNHSFYVQNWASGTNGPCSGAHPCAVAGVHSLIVNGVITQEFRGPVGTFSGNPPVLSTGYNKSYSYDSRLKYLSPPYFLTPTQSAWERISYAELKPNPAP
jgi:hypothetical protein